MDTILFRCRTLYNAALEQRRTAYRMVVQRRVTKFDQMKELPELKRELPEFKGVYAQVLQDVIKRLDKNFAAFFRRVEQRRAGKKVKAGYPRFKPRNRYNSFTHPQDGFSAKAGRLSLSGVGSIRMKQHRRVDGETKTLTIKRDVDRWYAVFSVELPDVPAPTAMPKDPVGIDAGLTALVTLSDGTKIANPRHLRKAEERLKHLQRRLSRKVKRSKNRGKARVRLAKAHRKVRDTRDDFHHKVSRMLVERYDGILVEKLAIPNMVKNHVLSKSIFDAGWSGLIAKLEYKAASAGSPFARAWAAGTSQECSSCGATVPKALSERTHRCGKCGLEIDRDENAALNILRRGLEEMRMKTHTVGLERPELTPVEMPTNTPLTGSESASSKQDATPFRAW